MQHSLKVEHAKEGLLALGDAEEIFKASRASGGYFGKPWRAVNRTIEREKLLIDLRMLKNRARDAKLSKKIDGIMWGIDQIYINNVQTPIIYVEGMRNRDPLSSEFDLEKAQAQLSAVDQSLPLIDEARERINILER